MSLFLVVTTPFAQYPRGAIISAPDTISAIRSSEFSSAVVLVSDTVVPPPDPPPTVNLDDLRAAYAALAQSDVQQQQALSALLSVNAQQTASINGQTQTLTSQAAQINSLSLSISTLAAQVASLAANGGGGTATPPDLADDLPLAENDGVVLGTSSGVILVGDIR